MINSVFRTDKNYYPQVFLKESKYVVEEKKKITKCIIKDTEISSDESDKEYSDEKNFDEESYVEE